MSAFLNLTRKKYTIKKCRNCQIELTTFPQYEGKNAMQEKMSIKIVAISFFLMTSLRLQEKNIFSFFWWSQMILAPTYLCLKLTWHWHLSYLCKIILMTFPCLQDQRRPQPDLWGHDQHECLKKAKLEIASDKYFTMMVFDGKNKLNFGEIQAQEHNVSS